MKPLLVPLPGNEAMAERLADQVGGEVAKLECRSFPDGESYVRFHSALEDRKVALICSLDHPNEKYLPLAFAASTARELGAARIGLVAPYLAYMRQDKRFQPGEALTSGIFARSLSSTFDWLVTVDPHLHRRGSLSEIYEIPARTVQAAPFIASWISENVVRPYLIGPDEESEQWVGAIAQACGAPYAVLRKQRKGDRNVAIEIPAELELDNRVPVLMDDLISTGHTMMETIEQLRSAGARAPVCVAVHGIFALGAFENLIGAGAERIVTTNTVAHESNAIDVSTAISEGMKEIFG